MTATTQHPAGRALVLQHHPDEDPGALGPLLTAAGLDITTVELDHGERIPPLDGFDLLLAMGGPMDVWQEAQHPWLVAEKAAIRHWVADLGRPYLGVCLGHQLLADALGGTVGLMTEPEIGVVEITRTPEGRADRVFGDLPDVLSGLQWHGAAVFQPPEGAVVAGRERPLCRAGPARRALRLGRPIPRGGPDLHHSEVGPGPRIRRGTGRSGRQRGCAGEGCRGASRDHGRATRRLFQGIVSSVVGVALPQ